MADDDGRAKEIYARLGFRPVWKLLEGLRLPGPSVGQLQARATTTRAVAIVPVVAPVNAAPSAEAQFEVKLHTSCDWYAPKTASAPATAAAPKTMK